MRERYDEITGLGGDVVAIGTGDRSYAGAFVRDERIPFLVLVDDEVPDTSPFAYVSRIEEHLAAAAQLLQELQTRLDELEARGTDLTGRSSGTPGPR